MFKFIKEIYQRLTKPEKKFLLAATLLVLFLSSVTFLYGLFIEGNKFYTGYSLINGADKMVYLSQIEQARQDRFLLYNLYTSEPQIGYFSPLWLTLGWFSRLTTISPLFTYHLFRAILGFIFLYLLYLFISQIFSSIKWRKITFLVLALSSGLGVLSLNGVWTPENIFKNLGTDMWIVESNTFLSLSHSPSFILSQICLLLIFWWTIERVKIANLKSVLAIGLLALFLGIIHPFDLIIVYSILVVWFMFKTFREKQWSWPIFLKLLVIFVISFFPIIYFLLLRHYDSTFAGWAAQFITLSPKLFNYLVGYGLIFIAFIIGLYPAFKSKNKYLNFLLVWAVVSWFLLYLPLPMQRKLGNGMHIPMVLVGMWGVWFAVKKIKELKIRVNKWLKFITVTIVIILLLSSNIFILGFELVVFKPRPAPFYWSVELEQAFMWLRVNSPRDSVILAVYKTGTIIPAYTGRISYTGYEFQTINYKEKRDQVEKWFYNSNINDEQKELWLREEGVDYILWGELEKIYGDFQPGNKDYLEPIYQNQKVGVYKVKS